MKAISQRNVRDADINPTTPTTPPPRRPHHPTNLPPRRAHHL